MLARPEFVQDVEADSPSDGRSEVDPRAARTSGAAWLPQTRQQRSPGARTQFREREMLRSIVSARQESATDRVTGAVLDPVQARLHVPVILLERTRKAQQQALSHHMLRERASKPLAVAARSLGPFGWPIPPLANSCTGRAGEKRYRAHGISQVLPQPFRLGHRRVPRRVRRDIRHRRSIRARRGLCVADRSAQQQNHSRNVWDCTPLRTGVPHACVASNRPAIRRL
jgi:hypothetical protein